MLSNVEDLNCQTDDNEKNVLENELINLKNKIANIEKSLISISPRPDDNQTQN